MLFFPCINVQIYMKKFPKIEWNLQMNNVIVCNLSENYYLCVSILRILAKKVLPYRVISREISFAAPLSEIQMLKYILHGRSNKCLTTISTATRRSKLQCFDLCGIRDGCVAVVIDKTTDNKRACRLFRTCADQQSNEILNIFVRQ